jgi:hypothetical protein
MAPHGKPPAAPRPEKVAAFRVGISAESRAAATAEAWLATYPQPIILAMRVRCGAGGIGKIPCHIPAGLEINAIGI